MPTFVIPLTDEVFEEMECEKFVACGKLAGTIPVDVDQEVIDCDDRLFVHGLKDFAGLIEILVFGEFKQKVAFREFAV